jgi:predicted MFS family arabinose efflux permease
MSAQLLALAAGSLTLVHGDALALPLTAARRGTGVLPLSRRSGTGALRAGTAAAAPDGPAMDLRGGGSGAGTDVDAANAQRAGRVVAVSAALGSLMQGYDTGVIGGALLFITPEFGLDAKPLLQGLIVTATTVGSVGGTLAASKLSEAFGRRGTMLLASAKFVTAALLLVSAPGVAALIAGRLLMGMAIGEASSVVPIYIAECADKRNRGALATIPQLCISSGILMAYSVSLAITLFFKGAWRLMLGFALVPALAQVGR